MNRAQRRHQKKLSSKIPDNNSDAVSVSPQQQLQTALDYKAAQALAKAEKVLRNLVKKSPDYKMAYNHLGFLLFEQQKYPEAAKIFNKAAERFSSDADIYSNLGTSLDYAGQPDAAIAAFQQALQIDKKHQNAAFNLGNLYKSLKQYALAEKSYLAALAANANDHDVQQNLLKLYIDQGRNGEALQFFEKIESGLNDKPELLTAMASSLLFLGKKQQAEKLLRKSIHLDPANAENYRLLSLSKKFEVNDPDLPWLEKQHQQVNAQSEQSMLLAFALGKAHEDIGEYDRAFAYFSEANDIKNVENNYSVDKAIKRFELIQAFFTRQNITEIALNKEAAPRPVFILGMPRSGTTLIEQILSSHSMVAAAGELEDIRLLTEKKLLPVIKNPTLNKQQLSKFTKNIERSANAYRDNIKALAANRPLVTDKMPGNFEFIGFILAMFPDAKIIHCTRNPLNNCWSVYKHFFVTGQQFSYSQDNLGQYYRGYQKLMAFWEAQFTDQICNLAYEEMVSDTENQVRKLLAFCNLPWDEHCLNFYENERIVKTASANQVRQPIYKDSVNIAEKYKNHLTTLRHYLDA